MHRRPPGQELVTVDAAARHLQLHPKTVLRCIRDGRLKATRIGKAYRIRRADVDAFAGVATPDNSSNDAWSTSIVDVPDADAEMARAWGIKIPAALKGRGEGQAPLRADVLWDAERSHLKVILIGPPGDVGTLLRAIQLWLDQPRATQP